MMLTGLQTQKMSDVFANLSLAQEGFMAHIIFEERLKSVSCKMNHTQNASCT